MSIHNLSLDIAFPSVLHELRDVPVVRHLLPLRRDLPELQLVVKDLPRLRHLRELEVAAALLLRQHLRRSAQKALVVREGGGALFQDLHLGLLDLVQLFQDLTLQAPKELVTRIYETFQILYRI